MYVPFGYLGPLKLYTKGAKNYSFVKNLNRLIDLKGLCLGY